MLSNSNLYRYVVAKVHATAAECLAAPALDRSAATGGDSRPVRDPNVRMFANEIARRLHVAVTNYVGHFSYSMIGALQLKRDLGEYEAWVRKVADSEVGRAQLLTKACIAVELS